MLRWGNIARRAAATLVIAIGGRAIAQTDGAPPKPAEAMAVYEVLDGWLHEWSLPQDPTRITFPRVPGAAVTIRYGGSIIGRGTDAEDDGGTIVRAFRQAFEEAGDRLPIERDALYEDRVRQAAKQMAMTLELAGVFVPISPAEYADATEQLAPGVDGVAVRAGRRTAAMFPETMLVTSTDAGRALAGLVATISGDATVGLKRPVDLIGDGGFTFYRFRTVHLGAPGPGQGPVFLTRGGKVAPLSEMDRAGLQRAADGMARHIMSRRWPGVEKLGLMGTLHPVPGRYDPQIAEPAEQSAAILALLRYSAVAGPDAPPDVRAAAIELLTNLARVEKSEKAPWAEVAASAAAVAALAELTAEERKAEPALDQLMHQCRSALVPAFDAAKGFPEETPAGVRGLVAWALVRLDRAAGATDSGLGSAAVRAVFKETEPQMLPTQMPWLGWAELELSGDGPIAAAVAVREMRQMVWDHQLRPASLSPDSMDLVGGIVFSDSRAPWMPSWHGARPVAFIATMLGDRRLTEPGEFNAELVRLLEADRFIRQLAADQAACHMYGSPSRAMWGVRSSLWDQRMPLEATALGLLSLSETLRSLDAAEAGRGGR